MSRKRRTSQRDEVLEEEVLKDAREEARQEAQESRQEAREAQALFDSPEPVEGPQNEPQESQEGAAWDDETLTTSPEPTDLKLEATEPTTILQFANKPATAPAPVRSAIVTGTPDPAARSAHRDWFKRLSKGY